MKKLLIFFILIFGVWAFSKSLEEIKEKSTTAPQAVSQSDQTEEEQLEPEATTQQIAELETVKALVPWVSPDFSGQEDSIGWSPSAFDVPPGFKRRVAFWTDIYTKYSTKQALIHDAKYIDLVYKVVDFSDIEAKTDLNVYQREREKRKRIKEEKKIIKEQLLRIEKLSDTPSQLSPEDLAVFKKFHFIYEKNKFREATGRHRLRFQLGQKDRFALGVYFSGRYIREMEQIFREEKVPMELTRLPFVESSFNIYAYSRVGASGIWQFMRSTGKLFLKIDSVRDMRNDPLTATRAAARLLRSNYKMLGSWPLALTAYNHGPQGVAHIVKKLKTDDINEIVWNTTRRKFGFASENFYAEFLAALEAESHADTYFGRLEVSPRLEYEELALPRGLTLGQLAFILKLPKDKSTEDEYEKARLYNPFFTHAVVAGYRTIPEGFNVRIPKGFNQLFMSKLTNIDEVKVARLKGGLYKVLPGDTLSSISHEFGVSLKEIMSINSLSGRSLLRPGQKIRVPTMEN